MFKRAKVCACACFCLLSHLIPLLFNTSKSHFLPPSSLILYPAWPAAKPSSLGCNCLSPGLVFCHPPFQLTKVQLAFCIGTYLPCSSMDGYAWLCVSSSQTQLPAPVEGGLRSFESYSGNIKTCRGKYVHQLKESGFL